FGGGRSRITLWGDGRSEISVPRRGQPMEPHPGWSIAEQSEQWSIYRKTDSLPADEVQHLLKEAREAGIERLETYTGPVVADDAPSVVHIRRNGKYREIIIHSSGDASANGRRCLAVAKVFEQIDLDAFDGALRNQEPTIGPIESIRWTI